MGWLSFFAAENTAKGTAALFAAVALELDDELLDEFVAAGLVSTLEQAEGFLPVFVAHRQSLGDIDKCLGLIVGIKAVRLVE